MILKASQRAGAKQLAVHLSRLDENDHVEVHQIRGFAAPDLTGALREAYAISRGTKCRQFLFSVSLSPPPDEKVPVEVFERAIAEIEEQTGLTGQPRVIVFHEKNGRRHAHCVWSRIKASEMKAVNLPHFKLKLREISRGLFIEHRWKMPQGLVNSTERNPFNFSREEWQQAKRAQRDPAKIKEAFRDCFAVSDGLKAFRAALEARGYYLAQGDRRSFVVVDWQEEVYSLSRWSGVRTKDLTEKLGDPSALPSVEETQKMIVANVAEKLRHFAEQVRHEFEGARLGLQEQRRKLVAWQRHERQVQRELQTARSVEDAHERARRFRPGLRGLWDRVTGRHAAIRRENEADFARARLRDEAERRELVERHLADRKLLHQQLKAQTERTERQLQEFRVDRPRTIETVPPVKPKVERKRRRSPQANL